MLEEQLEPRHWGVRKWHLVEIWETFIQTQRVLGFLITPNFQLHQNSSHITMMHRISVTTQIKIGTKLGIGNFGVAWAKKRSGGSGLKSTTFGINYTKVNDFNNEISYEGFNQDNSIIDSFIDTANGAPVSQFEDGGSLVNSLAYLAYNNYLIGPESFLDENDPDDMYFTDAG